MLRRIGNKSKIAKSIEKRFPKHTLYAEPFFGSGGMFFNKAKAKYNLVNDIDQDVFNFYQVILYHKKEFYDLVYQTPLHSDLLNYWKEVEEESPLLKALRFLYLSNFTLYGNMDTMRYRRGNDKMVALNLIDPVFEKIHDVQFTDFDFEKHIKIAATFLKNKSEIFIYADPPYLNTTNTYKRKWTEDEFVRLLLCLEESGCNYAVSEFDHSFVLEQAKKRNLNVHVVGERQNLKNRRNEILLTNYQKTSLF